MHDHFKESLSEYLDGELEPAVKTELEEHLRGCAECRSTLAGLRSVVQKARTLAPREPSAKLWQAIARETVATESSPIPLGVPGHRSRSGLLVAAALLVATTLGAAASAWWLTRETAATESASAPRWLLLLHETAGNFDAPEGSVDMPAIIGRYVKWNREHAEIGEKLADARPLRLDPGGARSELDSEDQIGGLFIIEAADEARAIELAQSCPHLDYGGWIELRRIEDTHGGPDPVEALDSAK
ncbi:MAG TPA: zf-HC2 domain-containing protein [Planctomycetota bacterium]|nr:zf-HC2 domain-containing protein [Planctomycetota bacterium]